MWKKIPVWKIFNYFIDTVAVLLFAWYLYQSYHGNAVGIFAVKSGSMVPVFNIGDLVFTHYDTTDLKIGDIVLFELPQQYMDILNMSISACHRIINIQISKGENCYLTKGDANLNPDYYIYEDGKQCVMEHEINQIAFEFPKIPFLGYISIWADYIPYSRSIFVFMVVIYFVWEYVFPQITIRKIWDWATQSKPIVKKRKARKGKKK